MERRTALCVVYVNIHLILLLFKYFKMSLLTGPGQFSSCLEVWFYGNRKKTRKFELVHLYSGLTWNSVSVFADTSFSKQIAMLTLLRMSVIGFVVSNILTWSQLWSPSRPCGEVIYNSIIGLVIVPATSITANWLLHHALYVNPQKYRTTSSN